MHTPERAKYPSLTTVEVLHNFLKCKQGEKENLIDYLSRFKSERDIVFRIVGRKFLDGFAEQREEYKNNDAIWNDEQKAEFKRNELRKFVAILFLRNSDYGTYNDLLVEYRKSFANKVDIYPKSLEDVVDVMRQQPAKKKKPKPAGEKTGNGKANGNGNSSDKDDQGIESSNAQTAKGRDEEAACFCCGDKSCRVWKCPKKDKTAPKDWYKPEHAPKPEETKAESSGFTTVEFSGAQRVTMRTEPDEILDSGSTITLGRSKEEMKNVRDVKGSVVMSTNAGNKRLEREGEWREWGKSFLDPSALTNIISISDAVRKGFRVLFDSKKENCFYVVDPHDGKVIRFPMRKGLYVRDSEESKMKETHWTSVEGFTRRQIERAQQARKFYHDLNAENVENVKYFIRSNQAKNVEVTTEDMNLAEQIFGLDVPNTKGKWTNEKP